MNTILTDDEIDALELCSATKADVQDIVAAVLAKLREQEPVAWMREGWGPDCGPYVEFYRDDEMGVLRERKDFIALYTHPAPQQADRQRVPDDLKNRCVEILGWQKTGVLTGNALREFAKQKYGDDPHALQMAETETAREAYRVIATAPEAPAQASEADERDRKDAERYRWLREQMLGVDFDWDESGKTALCFEMPDGCSFAADCDQVIDDASAALAQKGGR